MIYKSYFSFEKISAVVLIGNSSLFENFIEINSKLKIETFLYSTESKVKISLPKNKTLVSKKFDVDKLFKKFPLEIENTIFIANGCNFFFDEKSITKLKGNLVNFHNSRLPLDSGRSYYSWQIMRRDRLSTQLIHAIDNNIDTGPIVKYQTSVISSAYQTPKEYEYFDNQKTIKFYLEFIQQLIKGYRFTLTDQPKYLGRYNPALMTRLHGLIDWNMEINELCSFINAFEEPYHGASTFLDDKNNTRVFIKSVQVHGGDTNNHSFLSGVIYHAHGDYIIVATKSKESLIIEKVTNEKGENILKNLKLGDRFQTPKAKLDEAISKRVFYEFK